MPEGDAVYRFARRIEAALKDEVIIAARAQGPGPIPQVARIKGQRCTGVETHGKNLFIHLDNGLSLRGHLRMFGTWHVYAPGQAWRRSPQQARLVLETDRAVVVNFSAPVIELLETRALGLHQPVANLGPDLLGEEFDAAACVAAFRDPALADSFIGDALMDQRLAAGIGNIWKHEVLFRQHMNPWRRVGELSDAELEGLLICARELLMASVGKPLDPNRPARRPTMFTYLRGGQPCMRCYTRLRSAPQGADIRHTAWCPKCQPVVEGQAPPPQGRIRQLPRARRTS